MHHALIFTTVLLLSAQCAEANNTIAPLSATSDPVALSLDLLHAARTHGDPTMFQSELASYPLDQLKAQLPNDATKLAFWINVYNATVVLALQKDPGLYKDRSSFFSSDRIKVAGHELSLDDIEHGMIRHSKIKLSYGHFNNPFPGKFERTFRVKDLDYRIHFTLNCGAKSCPPVAAYQADGIFNELQESMELYLKKDVKYDKNAKTVSVPAFMGWFRADFGGKCGMVKILKKTNLIPEDAKPKVLFSDYDWTMDIDNFR